MKFEEVKVYILIFRMHQNDTEEVKIYNKENLIYFLLFVYILLSLTHNVSLGGGRQIYYQILISIYLLK